MAPRNERKLMGSGGRLVAAGTPLVIVGLVVAIVLDGTAVGIGAAIALLAAIPVVVGVTLIVSAGVERRARKDQPFA
jgi:hypothetical protein